MDTNREFPQAWGDRTSLITWVDQIARQYQEQQAQSADATLAGFAPGPEEIKQLRWMLVGQATTIIPIHAMRLLVAAGLLQWEPPAAVPTADVPALVVGELAARAMWPIVIAANLPLGWQAALEEITSLELVHLLAKARARAEYENVNDTAEWMLTELSRREHQAVIAKLCRDMGDPKRGGAELITLAMVREKARQDVTWPFEALAKWIAIAAASGVVGNLTYDIIKEIVGAVRKLLDSQEVGRAPGPMPTDGGSKATQNANGTVQSRQVPSKVSLTAESEEGVDGWQLIEQGDYDRAIVVFTSLIKKNVNDPNHQRDEPENYRGRGIAHRKKGDLQLALLDYDQAQKEGSLDDLNWCSKGIAYEHLRDYDAAFGQYERVMLGEWSLGPGPSKSKAAECFAMGELSLRGNSAHMALKPLEEAIALDPGFAEAYYVLGKAFLRIGQDDQALNYITRTIELSPHHFEAFYSRSNLQEILGRRREANLDKSKYKGSLARYARLVGELAPDKATQVRYQLGRFPKIWIPPDQYYDSLIKQAMTPIANRDVGDVRTKTIDEYFILAKAFESSSRYAKALNELDAAIATGERQFDAYVKRAHLYLVMGDKKRSLEDEERARQALEKQG